MRQALTEMKSTSEISLKMTDLSKPEVIQTFAKRIQIQFEQQERRCLIALLKYNIDEQDYTYVRPGKFSQSLKLTELTIKLNR